MAFTIDLLRPDDLVALSIEPRNLKLDTANPKQPKLVVETHGQPAYLIVQFPQQSILERAYFETGNITANPGFNPNQPPLPGNEVPPAPGQVPSRLSGDSYLVFKLPAALNELAYTTEALLDWARFELVVSPLAQGRQVPPPIVPPTELETAIELPYRLVISPGSGAGWANAQAPFTYAGRTELWHTRLGRVVTTAGKATIQEASLSAPVPMRAIWSPDFKDHQPLPDPSIEAPFRAAMSPNDRAQIVILTSGTVGYEVLNALGIAAPFTPTPFNASRVFLSTLGGWLTSRGGWSMPPFYPLQDGPAQQLDLVEWNHVATNARDHYVRIVYEGFLYPFGHAASLVKVTERKIAPPDGISLATPTAYLREHMYIVVRQHEVKYDTGLFAHAGRELPFWQSIEITTQVTPDIDPPADPNAFWIEVNNANFLFHCRALDLAGRNFDFLSPLIFMSLSEISVATVQSLYRSAGDARACLVKSDTIAYADPAAGDTSLKTTQLYFDTEVLQAIGPFAAAPFVPVLAQAVVNNRALDQLLGTNSPVTIALYQGYLTNGLDPNAGVFAAVVNIGPPGGSVSPLGVALAANKAGGFASPGFNVTGFSARKGLVSGTALEPDPNGGLADAAAGLIAPGNFFAIDAALFGTVPLQIIIPVDGSGKAGAAQNTPVVRIEEKPNSKKPTTVVTEIEWSPQLVPSSQSISFNQGGTSALTVSATITRDLAGGTSSSSINGKLTNFLVSLVQIVDVTFTEITFNSQNGSKTNVVAHLATNNPVVFQGALGFVQKLAEVLPPGIFGGSGPSIDLQPTQLRVSYTLGLPPLSIGVFSLEHISILTALDLPYLDGKPALEFAFASRSKPFLLTIECLGGGGFVHLVLDTQGVRMVEGALEFGGEFSLDLGVASGSVHILAGIYFQLKSKFTDLTGFVDVGGEVSVLGIISISIDLNLSLSYIESDGHKTVQGRATLTVSVHVLFFSASVQLSVEKSFSAGSVGPRVIDVWRPEDWAEYAAAFA
jgi:hypothetical protein